MRFLVLLRWEFSSLIRLKLILALIAFTFFTVRLMSMPQHSGFYEVAEGKKLLING